jgi:hypothetical protein
MVWQRPIVVWQKSWERQVFDADSRIFPVFAAIQIVKSGFGIVETKGIFRYYIS